MGYCLLCRYDTPLVADIHFSPLVASMVADCFEKIRVNPGNFVDGRKKFDEKVYDDDSQFLMEQEQIREVRLDWFGVAELILMVALQLQLLGAADWEGAAEGLA